MPEILPPSDVPSGKDVFLPQNVGLHIFLSPHGTKSHLGDFANFKRSVRQADIVIFEVVGWEEQALKIHQKISKGDGKLYQRIKQAYRSYNHPFVEHHIARLQALFSSNSTVLFVDVPQGHPLAEYDEFRFSTSIDSEFEDALRELDEAHKDYERSQRLREEYVLQNMGPRLSELIENHPKLRDKDRVSVFMEMGSYHARILERLQQQAEQQREASGLDTPLIEGEYSETAEEIEEGFEGRIFKAYRDDVDLLESEDGRKLLVTELGVKLISSFYKLEIPYEDLIVGVGQFTESQIKVLYNAVYGQVRDPNSAETKKLLEAAGQLLTGLSQK